MSDVLAGPPESAAGPIFTWGATTHVGGVRSHNEDAFYVSDGVCVVADGMGGHEAGEVASQLVTQLVSEVFGGRRPDVTDLPSFVSALNAAVLRKGAENNTRGMGTTVVGVAVADNGGTPSAVVFHVGDSRCYRLARGLMTQLTTDHSHVQDLIEEGLISPEEASTHPLRNVITRALGADAAVEADFHVLPEENCRLLLCSDGLSGEIDDDRIRGLLATHVDPSKAAIALVEDVLNGPARDNVTAIVLDLTFAAVDPTNELPRGDIQFAEGVEMAVEGDAGDEPRDGLGEAVELAILDVPWASPTPDTQTQTDAGRPSAPPDAAPWGSPNPLPTDTTPQ